MKNSNVMTIVMLGIGFVMTGMAFTSALKIIPYERSLLTAREKAIISNKDVLVFFTSRDCHPCNEIETLINNDERINSIVDDRLLCARIDVDNFDGKATQQRYDIRKLPAMVIIDGKGKIKSKQEGFSSVKDISEFIIKMPAFNPETFIHETPTVTSASSKPSSSPAAENVKDTEMRGESGLNSNYTVQIGVFGSKANASQVQQKAKENGFTDIRVVEEVVSGKNIVRVYCGSNLTKEAAESIKTKLERAGINGFVKNL